MPKLLTNATEDGPGPEFSTRIQGQSLHLRGIPFSATIGVYGEFGDAGVRLEVQLLPGGHWYTLPTGTEGDLIVSEYIGNLNIHPGRIRAVVVGASETTDITAEFRTPELWEDE